MLWSEDAVVRFFGSRIPLEISTAAAFHKWREAHEDSLMLGMADVVWEELKGLEFFPTPCVTRARSIRSITIARPASATMA